MKRVSSLLLLFGLAAAMRVHAQPPSAALKEADAAYKAGQAALARRDLSEAQADFARVVRLAPGAEQGHSALGAVLVSGGDTTAGIAELRKALAISPSDHVAELNLALAYEQSGSPEKAIPYFQKAEAAARARGTALAPASLAAYARALAPSRLEAATAKMREAVATGGSDASLHDQLGSLYARAARWAEAEQQFREAARLQPGLAAAHLHLGVALAAENKTGALEELSQAVQLAPTNTDAQLALARLLVGADRDQEALPILEKLRQNNPKSIEIAYQLALVLQRSGSADRAIPLFEQTIAADPRNAEAETNLGMALTQIQRAKDAIPHLKHATEIAPSMVSARENLAAAYIQLNQLSDAVAELLKAIELEPGRPELRYNLGLAYKMQDDPAKAIPQLEAAEKLKPEAPEAPYALGLLYLQDGRYDEAARELARALNMQKENGEGWATLGSVYARLDKLPEATAALQQAIKLEPLQADPHLTLATVLAKQGNTTEAAAERKKAAALMRSHMNRQRAEVATNAANGLLTSGKIDEAIAEFKEAVSFDENYPAAHQGLSAAEEKKGNLAESASERLKAQTLEHSPNP